MPKPIKFNALTFLFLGKKSTSDAWEIHGVEILDSLPVIGPLLLAVKVKLLPCIAEVIGDGLHCHTLPNAKIFVSNKGIRV